MPTLYVVATPIGNLDDLTPRMRAAIEASAFIAAEDTRVTQKLLNHWGIARPMVSNHRHNEGGRAAQIVRRMLDEGVDAAVTCDAGTPGISDPGMELVAAAWEAGIKVTPVSGPSAAITALSAAGFDAREFAFYGFLPRENADLRKKLDSIARGPAVAVLYESPHRVVNLIEQIANRLPGARVCVCCDLTKRFELIVRAEISAALEALRANPNVEKGEYCIVLELPPQPEPEPNAQVALAPRHRMLDLLMDGLSIRDAVKRLANEGVPRSEAYDAGLELKRLFEGDESENDD